MIDINFEEQEAVCQFLIAFIEVSWLCSSFLCWKKRSPLPRWGTHTHPCLRNLHQCTKMLLWIYHSQSCHISHTQQQHRHLASCSQLRFGLCMSPRCRNISQGVSRGLLSMRGILSPHWPRGLVAKKNCSHVKTACSQSSRCDRGDPPSPPPFLPSPPLWAFPSNRLQISAALFWFCEVDYVIRRVRMSQFLQNNRPLWFRSRLEAQMQMSQHSWALFFPFICQLSPLTPLFFLFTKRLESEDHDTDVWENIHPNNHSTHSPHSSCFSRKTTEYAANYRMKQWLPSDDFLLLNIVTVFLPRFLFPLNLSPNQASPSCCIAANDPHWSPVRPLQHLSLLRPLDPSGTHTRWHLHIKVSPPGRLHQAGVWGERFQKALWGAISIMCYITHEANESLEINIQTFYCFYIAWVLKFAVLICNSCRIMSG